MKYQIKLITIILLIAVSFGMGFIVSVKIAPENDIQTLKNEVFQLEKKVSVVKNQKSVAFAQSLHKAYSFLVSKNITVYNITQEALFHNKNLNYIEASYIATLIVKYSEQFKVDPYLIVSMIIVESSFKQSATSPKNAIGLMQLTNVVERIYNVDATILEDNLSSGIHFISDLLIGYNKLDLALAHYNGGSRPYYKIEHYPETKNYVAKVISIYDALQEYYLKKENI